MMWRGRQPRNDYDFPALELMPTASRQQTKIATIRIIGLSLRTLINTIAKTTSAAAIIR